METTATATTGIFETEQPAMATSASLTVDGRTLPEAYRRRVQASPDRHCYAFRRNGTYEHVAWKEYDAQVRLMMGALQQAGLKKGDSVAIHSRTRPEWWLVDLANLNLGLVTVPVYPSSTPEDTAFILKNSGAKLLFIEDKSQAKKIKETMQSQELPSIPIVSFDKVAFKEPLNGQALESFLGTSPIEEKEFQTVTNAVEPEDPATIVYTSGTTGQPKGVVLTHKNITSATRAIMHFIKFHEDDITLTFLPFSHILGRIEGFLSVFCGMELGFARNITTVTQDIQAVRPTLMLSVPRIFEKIHAKVLTQVETGSKTKRQLFEWATQIGTQIAQLRSEHKPIPLPLRLKERVAYQLVLSKVYQKMGGRLRRVACGGAPLSPKLCQFFHACGVPILEGYGLTETVGPVLLNPLEGFRFGTVGKPLGDTEMKIADDGEIWLRGSAVFEKYHDNVEATQASLTEDGWFKTGDIGEIDERGYLRITDRKKELIITAGGKNIAPQKIENLIKGISIVSNALVYGDRKKYLVALITLAADAPISAGPEAEKLLRKEILGINRQLASYETIKKFHLLPEDFTVESGELTPSLKLKRKVITQKYLDKLEGLY